MKNKQLISSGSTLLEKIYEYSMPPVKTFARSKIASALALMTISASTSFAAVDLEKAKSAISVVDATELHAAQFHKPDMLFGTKNKFIHEEGLEDKPYLYIVQFSSDPVPLYNGTIKGLEATNPNVVARTSAKRDKSSTLKMKKGSTAVKSYVRYLDKEQKSVLKDINTMVPYGKVVASLKYSLNAVLMELTPAQAEKVASLAGVKLVERNREAYPLSFESMSTVGAPSVWQGIVTDGVGNKGEGVVVGIIDTGINTDHPSFAEVDGDGYAHTNPIPGNQFLGDCAREHPDLCNNKLIGLYSYAEVHDVYDELDDIPADLPRTAEDFQGHGSHVAATAAGNVLYDVPLVVPEAVIEGDGIETGYTFPTLSGVAPRSNIVGYQVCEPGSPGDSKTNCGYGLLAIEDAIKDGVVDILNYSISGGGPDPWGNSVESAFLAARNAGIFVVTAAGNQGPVNTVKAAPWYTSVAASEHGKSPTVLGKKTIEVTSADGDPLEVVEGFGYGHGVSGEAVYAGADSASENLQLASRCLAPLPANAYENKIVVCEDGSGSDTEKADNIAAAGAVGIVLIKDNTNGPIDSGDASVLSIPGIYVSSQDGENIEALLSSHSALEVVMSDASFEASFDPTREDALATFTAPGPNRFLNILSPTLTAPGVDIYAAHSDQDYGNDKTGPRSADFDYKSGTSMASPHVAGAAALLKSAHPDWSPDNIRSALSMTADTTVTQSDGRTQTNWFGMGSGRIQVDKAVQAGLVMDEIAINYRNSNPILGGSPRTLNIPSMMNDVCGAQCSWERTVTATKDGTWTISGSSQSGLSVTVSPAEFSLREGQSKTLQITASIQEGQDGFVHGEVLLNSSDSPELHMPVVVSRTGEQGPKKLPEVVSIVAQRDKGSFVIEDIISERPESVGASLRYGKAESFETTIRGLSFPENVESFPIEGDGGLFALQMSGTDIQTVRAFLWEDVDGDKQLDISEIISFAGPGFPREETLIVELSPGGDYYIGVQNRDLSGVEGTVKGTYGFLEKESDASLSLDLENSLTDDTATNVRLKWDFPSSNTGDEYIGLITMDVTDESSRSPIEQIFTVDTETDVLLLSEGPERVMQGELIPYTIEVQGNKGQFEREYDLVLQLPEGIEVEPGSLGGGGFYLEEHHAIAWQLSKKSVLEEPNFYRMTTNEIDASCRTADFFGFDGGYLDLSEIFGNPLTGNGVGFEFLSIESPELELLGESQLDSVRFSNAAVHSNGIINFRSPLELEVDGFLREQFGITSRYRPKSLPGETGHHGVLAPFWSELLFKDDTSGYYLGSFQDEGAVEETGFVVEWENMKINTEVFGLPDTEASIDFMALVNYKAAQDEPQIIFGYDDVNIPQGIITPVTIGYESIDGKLGDMFLFRGAGDAVGDLDTDIVDGRLVCMYMETSDVPTTLSFNLIATDAFDESELPLQLLTFVTNDPFSTVGTVPADRDIIVEQAPDVTIDGRNVFLTNVRGGSITLDADIVDPNGGGFEVEWTQLSGPSVELSDNADLTTTIDTPELSGPAMVRLQLKVKDDAGLTDTAQAWLLYSGK